MDDKRGDVLDLLSNCDDVGDTSHVECVFSLTSVRIDILMKYHNFCCHEMPELYH